MARYVVVEGADAGAVEAAATAILAADGALRVDGWRSPPASARPAVCVGRVENAGDAADAVLAALHGARLVVDARAPREVIDQLCDDLRRLGELDHRVEPSAAPGLSSDERMLLAHLLAGSSLGDAARALHLSRRTADRRLASARATLGARTTVEALQRATEAGIRPAG